jgi:hypothetical protein
MAFSAPIFTKLSVTQCIFLDAVLMPVCTDSYTEFHENPMSGLADSITSQADKW